MADEFDPKAHARKMLAEAGEDFDPKAHARAMVERSTRYGPGEALALGTAQGATLGFFDEIAGALASPFMHKRIEPGEAATPEMRAEYEAQPSNSQLLRDRIRTVQDEAKEDHGNFYLGGEVLGGLAIPMGTAANAAKGAKAAASAAKAAKAATAARPLSFGTRLVKAAKGGAKAGGATGFVYGAGASTEEDLAGVAQDAAVGGVLGTATGGVLAPAAEVVTTAGKALVKGIARPNAAARYLKKKGVEDLTVGQMDPKSPVGQLEEMSTSNNLLGPAINAQRTIAKRQWQQVVANEARPPSMKHLVKATDKNQQAAELADEFSQAYGVLKGHRLFPEMHVGQGKWRGLFTDPKMKGAAKIKGVFDLATENRNIIATDESRKQIRDYLVQQVTQLPKSAQKSGMSAEHAQQLRSNIRAQVRDLMRGNPSAQERAQAEMLEAAEDGLTEIMEAQLPTEVAEALRAADSKYGSFATFEKAVARARDADAVTPAKLSEAIYADTNKRAYARGAGGELRKLAKAGKEVFEDVHAPNGIRMTGLPGLQWPGALAAALANRPGIKPLVMGGAPVQQAMRAWAKNPLVRAAKEVPGSPTQSWIRTFLDENGRVAMPNYAESEEEKKRRLYREVLGAQTR